jgi:hypothetical protein
MMTEMITEEVEAVVVEDAEGKITKEIDPKQLLLKIQRVSISIFTLARSMLWFMKIEEKS